MTSYVAIGSWTIVAPFPSPYVHSPNFSFGRVIPRMKFQMKPPTLGFPMSTQLAVLEK
jgi:hypothetical protein